MVSAHFHKIYTTNTHKFVVFSILSLDWMHILFVVVKSNNDRSWGISLMHYLFSGIHSTKPHAIPFRIYSITHLTFQLDVTQ